MIDRTIAPGFKQIDQIELIRAQERQLDNGIRTFLINAGEQDLIRIELIFGNVNWEPHKPLNSFITNAMLAEGTSTLNSLQIAERIDYYGAFIQSDYNYDSSTLTLYTLNKHLQSVLPIIKSILTDAIYPQEELSIYTQNQKQKMLVSLKKNDYVCRREFNHVLFGDTLYGALTRDSDFDNVQRDDLLAYFHQAYQPANCTIIASGKADEEAYALINKYLGTGWDHGLDVVPNNFVLPKHAGNTHFFEREDALQSALRLGGLSVKRSHPDFPGLQVLNTVLGGYFGSRLMSNIREDKGYTYGIGSALVSLQHTGYFFIASEVGAEVCQATLDEIQKEISILRTELVPDQELATVKNYMLGSLLGSLENAFSHADKFRNIYFSGLDYGYYDKYVKTVKEIDSNDLLSLANEYLDFDQFHKVVVGKL